jgi:hypothetical protein
MPGNLIYGGTWSLLPSAAFRHLYLVVACLDPIGDEVAYLARIAEDTGGNWDRYADDQAWSIADPVARAAVIQAQLLAAQRERHPVSMRDLAQFSGLQRSTVKEALHGLLTPIFGDLVDARTGQRYPPIALLRRGEAHPGRPTWYAPDRRAWDWSWRCEVLNARDRVQKARDRLWPHFLERRGRG